MLQIKNLTIKYGKRVIIDNQNITFNRGEITGIKGKSGTGKSSLLNVIGLIKTPNKECQYIFDGEKVDFSNEDENSLFRLNHIGFIFQQGNLLNNLTAIENVMLPHFMCEKENQKIVNKANEWIKYVNLEEVKDSYPEDLSGGEEQRIAIARAMINECDIILADEPTASLDRENSNKVMNLLKKLSHELNKIVIVVSHDEETISYSDTIYEIDDCKLTLIKETKEKQTNRNVKKALRKKTLSSFIKKYEKLRRAEYRLNRFLVVITAVIVSIASISIGFGDTFTSNQKEFINSISNRSLLVINDTLGLNATADYDDAMAFEEDTLNFIQNIPNIDKAYSYYQFTSYGMAQDIDGKARITILNNDDSVQIEKEYENTYLADGNEFLIVPLFEEENIDSYLVEGSTHGLKNDEVYLTYAMAMEITENPEELIGKNIEIHCYVPTKLYISEATKPKSKSDAEKGVADEVVEIDGYVSKLVKIEKKVAGILNYSYKNDKSDNNGKLILMNYSNMEGIIDKNRESIDKPAFTDFQEKELAPSMLVVFATNFDDVEGVEKKILNQSATISVINRGGDIEKTKDNLKGIKQTMIMISVVLIVVVTIMFSLLYYYKNRDRNKEIGILKALGLSQKNVLSLIGVNMVKNTIFTFGLSVLISVVAQYVLNAAFGAEFIHVSLMSVALSFVISVVTVFMSGMVSVWKTSKIDVIDAIRLNK